MTDQPHPVGDPLTAYRRALARAHRAEAEVRRLRALRTENTRLRAAQAAPQHKEQQQ